ncbi:MAG TPA: Rne/Rng family ribonuclease [Alphaproteobacteria bacterium]|nr:Rne/Rng family ribonuclease [Alphaproteobacteria bacterium]
MAMRMLIDAAHPEETRVAVLKGNRLEDFDFETATKKQLKGNIYLAKVTRVEPSLQAAFVDYGGNRHGFLAFNEVHPDYYRIPIADREALIEQDRTFAERSSEGNGAESPEGDDVETVGGDDIEEVAPRRFRAPRHYKIQEVIKRRQIMLVQVVKEERGNKGAALTSYLSLAGRYCVLMPNTPRGGGISRKITNLKDRRRLKSILEEFEVPDGMSVIVRTAGMERSKTEIKRDLEYLMRLWDEIRELTLKSTAPALIYEEANLIKRAIRDLYDRDIDEIQVEGEEGYRAAKEFMRVLTPSHAKRVHSYKDDVIPLFYRFQVESQIDAIYSPVVQLKSGGYIVLTQTEALVSIDVNSGRSTRERNIEETALRTNLEASEEIARQLRLRDLAGLIVIDFIDMEEPRNNAAVERRLKEAMRADRARIQIGRISPFGLLELSRQRLRPSLIEATMMHCVQCGGSGWVRSTESTVLHVLRGLEEEGIRQRSAELRLTVPTPVALYILNQKRAALADLERRYRFAVLVDTDDSLVPPAFRLERVKAAEAAEHVPPPVSHETVSGALGAGVSEAVEEPASESAEPERERSEVPEERRPGEPGEERRPGEPGEERRPGEPGEGRRRRRRRRRRRGADEEGAEMAPGGTRAGEATISSRAAEEGEAGGASQRLAEPPAFLGETASVPSSESGESAAAAPLPYEEAGQAPSAAEDERDGHRRRARGRRGGRRRRRGERPRDDLEPASAPSTAPARHPHEAEASWPSPPSQGEPPRAEREPELVAAGDELATAGEPGVPSWLEQPQAAEREGEEAERRHRERPRRHREEGAAKPAPSEPPAGEPAETAASAHPEPEPEAPVTPVIQVGTKREEVLPKKRGWWQRFTE